MYSFDSLYINAYYARHTEDRLRISLTKEQCLDLDLSKDYTAATSQDLLSLWQRHRGRTELDCQILFYLAQNPMTPAQVIDGMVTDIIDVSDSNSNERLDPHHRINAYLDLAMENPRLSESLMRRLCTEKIVDFQSLQARRHHLAKNPSLPKDLQKLIFKEEIDPQILGALAMNPACDREILDHLLQSKEWTMLRDACKNPHLSENDLQKISENPKVRRFALQHKNFDTSKIDIYKEKSADLGFLAKNPNTTQKQLRDIEMQISVFKNNNDIKIDAYIGIATHKCIDDNFLQKVIDLPDTLQNRDIKERTLVTAALNQSLTAKQQELLLNAKTHPSYDLCVPLSYNPNILEKTREEIIKRGNPEAVAALEKNKSGLATRLATEEMENESEYEL